MSLTPQDETYLRRALDLARAAAAFASPNPTVGCVLTHNGQQLAEGAHHYDTLDHAEIAALKQAAASGHSVHGATAYVTLEPCSFHGRTGPCADALIASGITRCVVATVDPHPQVSGSGIAKLLAANIETIVLPPQSELAQQARRLNDAFAFSAQHHRPFVTLKSALSLDGKLAPAHRSERKPFWLTGPAARADVQQLRHAHDALLTGIGTILADNPSLTDRTAEPRRRPLLRVVLDSHLRLSPAAQIVAPNLLVVTTAQASAEREHQLTAQGAEVVRAASPMDLSALLETLHHRQIRSVLLEAGSTLNGTFLAANLVDRVVLYISESELGTDAIPFAAGQPSPYVLQQHLSSVTREPFPHDSTEDVRITGYLHDPWANR